MSLIESKGNRNNSNICDGICSFNPCQKSCRILALAVSFMKMYYSIDSCSQRIVVDLTCYNVAQGYVALKHHAPKIQIFGIPAKCCFYSISTLLRSVELRINRVSSFSRNRATSRQMAVVVKSEQKSRISYTHCSSFILTNI